MSLVKDCKTAVVTGGASGMGNVISQRLEKEGFQVVAVDVKPGNLEELREKGHKIFYKEVNITDSSAVNELFKWIFEETNRIDVLVCAAGIMEDLTPSETFPDSLWQKVIDINLTGAFYCNRAAIPVMKKQKKSHIINIVSGAAKMPCPGLIAYAASKAGLAAVTRTLAAEYGKYGIRVNGLMPGRTKTPLMIGRFEVDDATGVVPIGRFGKPEDIADLIAFLISDEADFIHGALINISGGMSID